MLRLERELDRRERSPRLLMARALRPPSLERRRAARTRRKARSPTRRRMSLGDYPEWLDPHLARMFGEDARGGGRRAGPRAPLDLRVNTLVADRDKAAAELAAPRDYSDAAGRRWACASRPAPDAKSPAIHAEPAFLKGMIEIQDEGSQLAALLAGATPGEQVVDLCAGGGGKTLALAAMMENHGQIYATDIDKRRLAPIHARLERAGARDVQVRTPRGAPRSARRPARAASTSS